MRPLLLLLLATLNTGVALRAEEASSQPVQEQRAPAYRLDTGDEVRVTVFDEPDLTTQQRLDDTGSVRLPLLGEVRLAGLSSREAEDSLERAFIDARLLRSPEVTVSIVSHRLRTALALGQFRATGNVQFPPDTERLDIVQFVTIAGGFTETARSSAVRISRSKPDGTEETFTIDVAAMLEPGSPGRERPQPFFVLPGDRVSVGQRIF